MSHVPHLDQVTDVSVEAPLVTDLRDDLRDLADRPVDWEHPYLTVTLDYRPEGEKPQLSPSLLWLDEQEKRLREEYGPRGPLFDAAVNGLKEFRDALDGLEEPKPQGIAAVFQPGTTDAFFLPLAVAPRNSITVGPTPALFEIAAVQDAMEAFAVLLADSKQAFLHVFGLGVRKREVAMKGSKTHLKASAVGNRMIERRALNATEQRLEDYAKAIGEVIRVRLDEMDVQRLVIAADEQITSTIEDHLAPEIKGRVLGAIRADIRSTPEALLRLALPLVEEAERRQEEDICADIVAGADDPDGLAVWGINDTLAALETGQVETLVLAEGFSAPGWADEALGLIGAGNVPTEHPAGGNVKDLRPVDLREEFVRAALKIAVGIEFVPLQDRGPVTESVNEAEAGNRGMRGGAVAELGAHEGVGAILRFRLATDQAVPNV